MANPVLIGIDLGTSKLVALAVDSANGEIVASSSQPNDAEVTSTADRRKGRSEWNAIEIARSGRKCLKQLAEQLGPRVADVAGIGITGQQHGMLLLDRTCQPCSPLINWQDRRGLETATADGQTYLEVARQSIGEEATQLTGCRLQSGFMALTLTWLHRNSALPRAARACFIMDYFASCLTGEDPRTDPTCAASAGVLNVRQRQWDNDAIQALQLSVEMFPEIREANERAGVFTAESANECGLLPGTPVFVPIGDHQASFVGSVADRTTTALLNVGTGAQVAAYTPSAEFRPPIELRPFPIEGNLLSNVGLAGGWSYRVLEEFFRDVGRQFFGVQLDATDGAKLFEAMNSLAGSIGIGADGLECEPTFMGTRSNPAARGAVHGISPQNMTAAHLCRAVLEGMAANYRRAYEQIEPFVARRHEYFAGAGNGLRTNPVLVSAVQKELARTIRFARHREEAAFGAAILATVASGICASIDEAAAFVRYEWPKST